MSAPRGPVVVDTSVFASRLTPSGKLIEQAYRPLLDGRPVGLAFVTVAELRFGALRAGWGEKRQTRLAYELSQDLVLTTAARYEQEHEVNSTTTRFLRVLVKQDDQATELLMRALPEVFPWVRFLPAEDARAFLLELIETLHAVGEFHNTAPVAQLIIEWRHTAEVHADPFLREILSRDADDFGPVPPPETVA